MEFCNVIARRYSVRAYCPDPVEDEKLQVLLEAARLAPTASNRQPFQLLIIHTAGRQEELCPLYHRAWFLEAPVLIVAVGIPDQAWVRKDGVSYLQTDIAIVMDHVSLAAADQGLGTCWIAAFDAQAVSQVLKLPETVEPLILMTVGYPAHPPKEKMRKELSKLVRYENWEAVE